MLTQELPQLSIVVAGRNDNYGGGFRERLFRATDHNSRLLQAAGISFEYFLAEWNPLPEHAPLSREFVDRVPNSRAVIVPPEIHRVYSLNPRMPFHEMAAKNAALCRASGDLVIVTNADILFGEKLVQRIARGLFSRNTLYRAHRIDVSPNLSWAAMQDEANQLLSGEGKLPPAPYLGAGGDFCLAARSLWLSLRGFNERVRFSTRAKDWQFFLSALAQGVGVEFIGEVYHLDHEGGFRNTQPEQLSSDAVHFGRWWDIEFGLPVTNPAEWGFQGLPERQRERDQNIVTLGARSYSIPKYRDAEDRQMMQWLCPSSTKPDAQAAVLLHAICAAQRQKTRLICRLKDPHLAATLSGFDVVAARFRVPIHCNWQWPSLQGHTLRLFMPEPQSLEPGDWIVEQVDDRLRVVSFDGTTEVDVLPKNLPVGEPEFNPLLARRLLFAYLHLQQVGLKRIALYGGGGHTRALLRWGLPDAIAMVSIVDSRSLDRHTRLDVDAVVISSASFESDMLAVCRELDLPNPIALYGEWPVDMWSPSAWVCEARSA